MTMDYLLWVCSLIVPAVLAVEGKVMSFLLNIFSVTTFCFPHTNNGAVWMDQCLAVKLLFVTEKKNTSKPSHRNEKSGVFSCV